MPSHRSTPHGPLRSAWGGLLRGIGGAPAAAWPPDRFPEPRAGVGPDRRRSIPFVQTGFEARRFVQIVITDAARVGEAMQALLNAGLNFVYNVTYTVDDKEAARDEAIRLALEDARQQAESIARYMGMRLGRVLSISGSDASPGYYQGVGAESVPMDPAPVSIQVSLTVTYELLEP
ncbi:MAG: hypothetical protein DIU82_07900 [Bacillota bacterium]|nr:MAG: hypothetical protein DIU82_07900 [Bacillota bacterium]